LSVCSRTGFQTVEPILNSKNIGQKMSYKTQSISLRELI
jgi:hypothetical protein